MLSFPYSPTTWRKMYLATVGVWEGLGGTPEGAAAMPEDAWPKIIDFLHRELTAD